jgi:hypothetical protein
MKKNKIILASMVLGILYLLYLVTYFTGINTKPAGSSEAAGAAIATALILPHLSVIVLAVIFNSIAYFSSKRWAMITALVLYSVSGILFIPYILFLLPMIVLSAMGVNSLGKKI